MITENEVENLWLRALKVTRMVKKPELSKITVSDETKQGRGLVIEVELTLEPGKGRSIYNYPKPITKAAISLAKAFKGYNSGILLTLGDKKLLVVTETNGKQTIIIDIPTWKKDL